MTPGAATERTIELSIEPVTRLGLCYMTAALDDPNPVHVDEPFALSRGLPSVIAHATVSYGLAGVALERWVGIEHVRRLSARFQRPVLPGAALTARIELDDERTADGLWRGTVAVVDQDGTAVTEGWFLLDRRPGEEP